MSLSEREHAAIRLAFDPTDVACRNLRPHQVTLQEELAASCTAGNRIQVFAPTGSGKTLAMNVFVFNKYLREKKRVVWIGHSWDVVGAAMRCLFRRFGSKLKLEQISHLAAMRSPDNAVVTECCEPLWSSPKTLISYTTFQTMYALMDRKDERVQEYSVLLDFSPDLVVIDESHIGVGGLFDTQLRKLLKNEWNRSCVVGMSATPRKRLGFRKVIGNFNLTELVRQNVIAKPNHFTVRLESPSKVKVDARNNIVTYSEIASCIERNTEIARHFYLNKSRYGKTIIFCANKTHANNLGVLLRGHNPLVIHGGVENAHQLLRTFSTSNEHNLALLVRMGTTGLDIPKLKTVMLAKPTTSDVEIVQMAGRAFRLAPGKRECNIVDFYENLSDAGLASKLSHFRQAFGLPDTEVPLPRAGAVANPRRQPLTRHTFVNEPATVHLSYDAGSPFHSALDGLHVNPNQTFGIEFEVTSAAVAWYDDVEWARAAKAIASVLRKALGAERVAQEPRRHDVHGIRHDKWHVVFDGSCGWEIVSPILKGGEGFEEVVLALAAFNSDQTLKKFKFKVDASTGCHVHFGYDYRQVRKFRNLVQFVRRFEAALFTLCAASRYREVSGFGIDAPLPNEYCTPLLGSVSDEDVASLTNAENIREMFCSREMRYHTVNLSLFETNPQRLEVRMHSGTTEPQKILLWVALWQNIFNCLTNFPLDVTGFRSDAEAPELSGRPDGDVVAIALQYLGLSNEIHRVMLEKLHVRRKEVISAPAWKKVLGARRQKALLVAWQKRFDALLKTT